jgi:hypothetical protein
MVPENRDVAQENSAALPVTLGIRMPKETVSRCREEIEHA